MCVKLRIISIAKACEIEFFRRFYISAYCKKRQLPIAIVSIENIWEISLGVLLQRGLLILYIHCPKFYSLVIMRVDPSIFCFGIDMQTEAFTLYIAGFIHTKLFRILKDFASNLCFHVLCAFKWNKIWCLFISWNKIIDLNEMRCIFYERQISPKFVVWEFTMEWENCTFMVVICIQLHYYVVNVSVKIHTQTQRHKPMYAQSKWRERANNK